MKKIWTAILLLICLLLSFCSPALADSIKVYVSDNTLKVYEKATSSSKLLGTMAYGESMTCTEISDGWAKVKNGDGDVGFCKKSGLTTDNPNTMDDEVRIRKTGVKIYKKPSSSADVMLTVSEDNLENVYTAVAETEDGDWIRLKNGKHYGYVKAKYVIDADDESFNEEDAPAEDDSFNEEDAPAGDDSFNEEDAPVEDESFNEENAPAGDDSSNEEDAPAEDDSSSEDDTPAGDDSFNEEDTPAGDDSSSEDDAPAEDNSSNEEDAPAEDDSFNEEDAPAEDDSSSEDDAPAGDDSSNEEDAPEGDTSEEEVPGEEAPEEQTRTIYIIKNTLKVYKKASSGSACLGVLSYGEELILLEEEDNWAKVQNASGDVGYCRMTGVSEENPNTLQTPAVTKRSSVKVYKRADDDSSVLLRLSKGDEITVLALFDDEDWARVKLADGTKGYVQMKYLELGEEAADESNPDEDTSASDPSEEDKEAEEDGKGNTAAAIIALAKAQLGDPYIYAASGPDSFDCSGFVYYCFREVTGIKLSRTAYSQGYNDKYPKIESASELQLGDLVFFNTNSNDSDLSDHSGIYIGSGKFIHASSAAAEVVISNLTSDYYQRTFSWGRRVL